MASRGTNQRGASILIVILAIVIVGIIAIAGLLIYSKKVNPTKNATADVTDSAKLKGDPKTKQVEPEPATEMNKNIVKIPELGIQLTVPDSIKDLTYKAYTGSEVEGRSASAARFSTASLTQLDSKCEPEAMPLGSISTIQGQYPGDPKDANNIDKYGLLYKQFSAFYVIVGGPQEGCSTNNKDALSAQSTYKSEFTAAQSTIKPIE